MGTPNRHISAGYLSHGQWHPHLLRPWVFNVHCDREVTQQKLPAMVLCLGEPTGGFCDICCCFLFFIHCCCSFVAVFVMLFLHFRANLCHRHSTLASQACEGLHQLWALLWLLSIAFAFLSTASATILSEHFLPTGVFFLALLPQIFDTTCFYLPAVLPWSLQGLMLILETQTRLICLFDSQQSTTLIFRKIPF